MANNGVGEQPEGDFLLSPRSPSFRHGGFLRGFLITRQHGGHTTRNSRHDPDSCFCRKIKKELVGSYVNVWMKFVFSRFGNSFGNLLLGGSSHLVNGL